MGILAFSYVAPMALVPGVLAGVMVGWWAGDIVKLFINSVRSVASVLKYRKQVEAWLRVRIEHGSVATRTVLHWTAVVFQHIVAVPALLCTFPLFLLRRFRNWVSHPTGMATMITISAIMVAIAINMFAVATLCPWPETHTIHSGMVDSPERVVPFTFSNVMFFSGIITFFLAAFGFMGMADRNIQDKPMRNFYARWERYSRSPMTFFIRELYFFFMWEIKNLVGFSLLLVYWVTLGGTLLVLVNIPVTMLVTFLVGLYRIGQRRAHWWCLSVTLMVTCVSALFFYRDFGNEMVLWTVALCTGILSGALTEGLRRLGLWWGDTKMGSRYLIIWHEPCKTLLLSIAVPAWKRLWKTSGDLHRYVMSGSAA